MNVEGLHVAVVLLCLEHSLYRSFKYLCADVLFYNVKYNHSLLDIRYTYTVCIEILFFMTLQSALHVCVIFHTLTHSPLAIISTSGFSILLKDTSTCCDCTAGNEPRNFWWKTTHSLAAIVVPIVRHYRLLLLREISPTQSGPMFQGKVWFLDNKLMSQKSYGDQKLRSKYHM